MGKTDRIRIVFLNLKLVLAIKRAKAKPNTVDENAVKVISNEVGYKDTAYFCRRFKLMFGVQAGKMRKRLSEI